MSGVRVKVRLSPIFTKDGVIPKIVDSAILAALAIIETAYVKETPVDISNPGFRGGIQRRKIRSMEFVVESTATSNRGANYPLFLFGGTGRLKGAPDFGYTPGRVRSGTVAYGIGGIRPNKAATRAKDKSAAGFLRKVNQLFSTKLQVI